MTATLGTRSLTIRALGDPVPQGSMKAIVIAGRARLFADNAPKLKRWRNIVTLAAFNAMHATGWQTIDGPVHLELWFLLAKPPSAPRRRVHPDRKPDLDKLARAALDSLTVANVYVDDARAVTITAGKRYAAPGEQPGALIIVRPVDPTEGAAPVERAG